MVRFAVAVVLLPLLTGCATAHLVNLETDQGEVTTFTLRGDGAGPVRLQEEEFKKALSAYVGTRHPPIHPETAARRLFEIDAREGSFHFDPRTRRVTQLGPGERLEEDVSAVDLELTRAYLRWCERTGRKGDCLRLLTTGRTLSGDGRYALAMAIAQGSVNEEMLEAFKDMADPNAMLAAALWTGTLYLVLWSVPEPVSKGLAAAMTATLMLYLGVDTFWGLITGFRGLVDEADRARTFDELRDAGQRYGKVMGRNAARAFAMIATIAIGNTAAGFASAVPSLPGSAQAAMQAGSPSGLVLSAVGEVQAVSVSGGAVTIELSPGAVAMATRGSVDAKGHEHHIATDKWWDSPRDGGPWSPRFQSIFDSAGMSLNDPANIVNVNGHKGPHPQEYHKEVFKRLFTATRSCRSMQQCRRMLTEELQRLAHEISTKGTELYKLVTRTE